MAAAPTGPRAATGAHDDGNAFAERFLAHEAAAGLYLDEGVRRALEDNQRQIAEAEQRQRERDEREGAEAHKAQEAERAAYYAKHGWPT